MAKNIVICCDGTGNEFGDHNSNVVKLYSALIIDGKRQVGYYHPGVGTMGAPTAHNKISEAWSVVMGLAFGAGLLANVGDAYRYLMNVYEDGDRVYLFGFSRGAYTVRALGGVIHMFGLLCPGNNGLIPYIIRLYARRTRNAAGMKNTFEVADGFKFTFCRDCPLHFVGVWDTVSSVGLDLGSAEAAVHGTESGNTQWAGMRFRSMNGAVIFETTCGEISFPAKTLSKSGSLECTPMWEVRMQPLKAACRRLLLSGCFVKRSRWDCWLTRQEPSRCLRGFLQQRFRLRRQCRLIRRRNRTIR